MSSITTIINSAKTLEELRETMPRLTRRDREVFQSIHAEDPLFFAVNSRFMEAIKYYLALGLEYEGYEKELLQAIMNHNDYKLTEEICKVLFEKSTSKKALANALLVCSITYGDLFFLKIALKEGADKHISEPDTVLSICAKEDIDNILEEFLKINKFSQESLNSALSKAKTWNSEECILLLKKHGAEDSCVVM